MTGGSIRPWSGGWLSFVAACGVLAACGSRSGARDTDKEVPGTSIMAFNVLYSADDNQDSIRVIQQADPDTLCLRELTPGFVKDFNRKLGRRYPHRFFEPRRGTWGAGIASKHPLRRARLFQQRPHRMPGLEAEVRIQGTWIRVACLHLFPPVGKHRKSDGLLQTMVKNANLREQQAAAIARRYEGVQGPVILLGDMNEEGEQRAMQTFVEAAFERACVVAAESSCGPTWPGKANPMPAFFEIDHILGRNVTFLSARVIPGGNSDHHPVFATFSLRESGQR